MSRSLTNRPARKRCHRYAREVGLPLGVTPHRARATSLTEALERKCPMEAVPASFGRRSIATTTRYDQRHHRPEDSPTFRVEY